MAQIIIAMEGYLHMGEPDRYSALDGFLFLPVIHPELKKLIKDLGQAEPILARAAYLKLLGDALGALKAVRNHPQLLTARSVFTRESPMVVEIPEVSGDTVPKPQNIGEEFGLFGYFLLTTVTAIDPDGFVERVPIQEICAVTMDELGVPIIVKRALSGRPVTLTGIDAFRCMRLKLLGLDIQGNNDLTASVHYILKSTILDPLFSNQ